MKVSLDEWNKCKRKIRYGRHATAKRAIEAMARKGSRGLPWYECEYCNGFHIGHRSSLATLWRLVAQDLTVCLDDARVA